MHTLSSILGTVTNIVLLVLPIVGSIILIAFFWNLASFLFNASDVEKMKQAKQRIFWAIVTMFVLFTIGGIVALLGNTFFGIGSNSGANSGCTVINGVPVCNGSQSGSGSNFSDSQFNTGIFNSDSGVNPGSINTAGFPRNVLPTPNETPP